MSGAGDVCGRCSGIGYPDGCPSCGLAWRPIDEDAADPFNAEHMMGVPDEDAAERAEVEREAAAWRTKTGAGGSDTFTRYWLKAGRDHTESPEARETIGRALDGLRWEDWSATEVRDDDDVEIAAALIRLAREVGAMKPRAFAVGRLWEPSATQPGGPAILALEIAAADGLVRLYALDDRGKVCTIACDRFPPSRVVVALPNPPGVAS